MSLVPFEGAIEGLEGILNKFIPDTAARDAAKAEITTLMIQTAAQSDAAQAQINQTEAASNNLFVSGWRPALGWICDIVFFEHYILIPVVRFVHSCIDGQCIEPQFDIAEINLVLWALLGIGAFRTVDKGVGVIMNALK